MYRVILLLLLTPAFCLSQPLDSDVLPFGVYGNVWAQNTTFWSEEHLNRMNDSLGINQILNGGFDTAGVRAGDFADAGIYPIPWEKDFAHHYYGFATYFVTEAEDESSEFRFAVNKDSLATINGDVYIVWNGNGDMLDDLGFNQYCRVSWLYITDQTEYYSNLKIAIDPAGLDPADLVAIYEVWNDETLRFQDSLFASDLPSYQAPDIPFHQLINDNDSVNAGSYYTVWDECPKDFSEAVIYFRFETFGLCDVYIDKFKVHCQYGANLVENHSYDNLIEGSAGNSNFDGKILAWYLKDEPKPGNYRPVAYINSLVKVAMADSGWTEPVRGITAFCQACATGYYEGIYNYANITHFKNMAATIYPYKGYTKYTGYQADHSLQKTLERIIQQQCERIRDVIASDDSTDSWTYITQMLADADCSQLPDTVWKWRPPTRSEVLCETYMGMCYHPVSIIYYKYKYEWNPEDSVCQIGIYSLGGERSYLYDIIQDDLNPYLKAIDSTYMQISWDTAYAINYENNFDPPPNSWIDTIYAVSDTPNSDLGWFHVGEFTDTAGAKYVMIVNRACSQGENDPDPAPSVTATVKFDPADLGLGNYVYVIDLADSLRLAGTDTGWVAIPDTTYTAKMPDGTIPFTTVLGPGEGRLFKIVQTSEKELSGNIATQYNYQGRIQVEGDITIPADETMKILGPARFDTRCENGIFSPFLLTFC